MAESIDVAPAVDALTDLHGADLRYEAAVVREIMADADLTARVIAELVARLVYAEARGDRAAARLAAARKAAPSNRKQRATRPTK